MATPQIEQPQPSDPALSRWTTKLVGLLNAWFRLGTNRIQSVPIPIPTADDDGKVIAYDAEANSFGYVEDGGGSVTSVAQTVPAEFSVAGSPVTTSGTLAITKATQTANKVWASATSGGAAQPAFRALVTADMPAGTGTVTSVGAVAPITSSGGATPTISTSMATDRLLGRDTAATGVAEEISVGGGVEFTGSGGVQTSAFTGDATKAAGGTALTLATVNADVGAFTNAAITVNAKGLVTAAASGTAPVTSVGATSPITSTGGLTPTIGMVNQGTTTTVLHGNAAGNPAFSTIVNADVDAAAAIARSKLAAGTAYHAVVNDAAGAMTGVAPGTSGNVLTSDGTSWSSAAAGGSGLTHPQVMTRVTFGGF